MVIFLGFAFIEYFLNGLIPAQWVTAVFGGGHVYSVPLTATLGLPLYVNTEISLPLVRALLDAGMSPGAAVIGLVVVTLWVGAILCGFLFDGALSPFLTHRALSALSSRMRKSYYG